MIPLGDDLPARRVAWMNYLIIALTVSIWIFVQGGGWDPRALPSSVCDLGMVPGELTHRAPLGMAIPMGGGWACVVDNQPINLLTPVISMFLHGGWGHLLGNMLFLWVFGDNIEDSMGHGRYLAFYLICGLAAAAAHVFSMPSSPVPTVGASGAISGIMGAYLLLHPQAPVRMFIPPFFVMRFRAWMVLLWWFAWQVIDAVWMSGPMRPEISGGVAVWAHVGGFVTGLLLIRLFVNEKSVARQTLAG